MQDGFVASAQGDGDPGDPGYPTAGNNMMVEDIFLTAARRIFEARGLAVDPAWAAAIADEFRTLLTDLHLDVREKPAVEPTPTRTQNGTLLLLMAALENGDLYVRDCALHGVSEAGQTRPQRTDTIGFDAGHDFEIRCGVIWDIDRRIATLQGVTAVTIRGTRYVTDMNPEHPLCWLAHYRPVPAQNQFASALQQALDQFDEKWAVQQYDKRGLWRWGGPDYDATLDEGGRGSAA